MTDINNTSAASYKKFSSDTISIRDYYGNYHLLVRSFNQKRKGWFNIAKREIIAKDKRIPKGYIGIIPDAVWFSDEEVAELIGEVEAPWKSQQLARAETTLKEWREFRKSWLMKPSKKGKLRLQKKEAIR